MSETILDIISDHSGCCVGVTCGAINLRWLVGERLGLVRVFLKIVKRLSCQSSLSSILQTLIKVSKHYNSLFERLPYCRCCWSCVFVPVSPRRSDLLCPTGHLIKPTPKSLQLTECSNRKCMTRHKLRRQSQPQLCSRQPMELTKRGIEGRLTGNHPII